MNKIVVLGGLALGVGVLVLLTKKKEEPLVLAPNQARPTNTTPTLNPNTPTMNINPTWNHWSGYGK